MGRSPIEFIKKGIFFALVGIWSTSLKAQPEVDYWNADSVFVLLPDGAFGKSQQQRLTLLQDRPATAYQWLIPPAVDTGLTATYTAYYLDVQSPGIQETFAYKLYRTSTGYFALTLHMQQDSSGPQTPLVQAFKRYQEGAWEFIGERFIRVSDYACTPADSAMMEQMWREGTLVLLAHFDHPSQAKGVYFSYFDKTLNTGPFEPPQTRAEKWFSDFRTRRQIIRITISSDGVGWPKLTENEPCD